MLIILYLLLKLKVGYCTDNLKFETKTVAVGEDVTLECSRPTSDYGATLFWIRLVSGSWPEFLGGTYVFDYDGVNKTPHITAEQKPGTYILQINGAKLSDTGLYYCIKTNQLQLTFSKGTFLRIKGPEPDITAVIQEPQSDLVHPRDPVTFQCSVLFDTEKKICSADHSVFWFRAGLKESHPSVIYVHGDGGNKCWRTPEANSAQKCVYSFSRDATSTDAGTYYCAVATCGQILFGNGTKLDIKANVWDMQPGKAVFILLSVALTASFVIIAFLICTIKKKTHVCSEDTVTAHDDQQSQQRDEASVIYSAPAFTRAGRRKIDTSEAIYTLVSATGND
ncbi:signal-regulatory protein beta-2-like isoform X2 [Melanotaenia boesemani]|nr:signal-regulatory protein beta-2-like isoform X2 [Melanotaenia boesemani]